MKEEYPPSKKEKTHNNSTIEDIINPEDNEASGHDNAGLFKDIEELTKKLSHEKDARREERFGFIVLCILLLDLAFFTVMESFTGPLAILILEIIILIPLARKLGREEMVKIMNNLIARLTHGIKGED